MYFVVPQSYLGLFRLDICAAFDMHILVQDRSMKLSVNLSRILTTNRPALLVFPFVALCRERAAEIKKLLAPLDKYALSQSSATLCGTQLVPCMVLSRT
jgi:hypothetical protein